MMKLKVKNFGKIEFAEIEMNKLLLFVGDNNSGKSYLSSLIYGLYDYFGRFNAFSKSFFGELEGSAYQELVRFIQQQINEKISDLHINNEIEFEFDEDFIYLIERVLNEYLELNKKQFMQEIFKYNVDIEHIEIEFDKKSKYYLTVLNRKEEIEESLGDSQTVILKNPAQGYSVRILQLKPNHGTFGFGYQDNSNLDMLYERLIPYFFRTMFSDETVYLPVARTGFVLSYKDLITNVLESGVTTTEYTKATNDFLVKLSRIRFKDNISNRGLEKIIEHIEEKVISGKINSSNAPIPDYTYKANGSDVELPMYISSGVVTEMTPLILFLMYVDFSIMIVEEPEMCLHPKLQWELTRAFIKATKNRRNFILTTHSEAIIQHINDMIKLNTHPNKDNLLRDFNYDDDDLISENDVCVYQFNIKENYKTTVEKLEYTDDGFIVSSFIDNLRQRLEETSAIFDEE